jgi:hypothetical protein
MLALSACYGSTEPATDVGEDGATLWARGTADKGPVTTWFEYWADGDPLPGGTRPRTPGRSFPGGVAGPLSEDVKDLLVASEYSFRLCGSDQGGTACAQTRTFSTPAPDGDYVKGSFAGVDPVTGQIPYTVRFNARSGPGGEDARGTVRFTSPVQNRTDTVVCLRVNDIFATIGTVTSSGTGLLYAVREQREEAPGWATAPTGNPPDCGGGNFTEAPHTQRSFVIHDEAQPTTAR